MEELLGHIIGGCDLLEVIAQGGMGIIYKGRQKSLDRFVAVKVLTPHLAKDVNFVARFQREARAIARINHPNILAVYDVGEDQNVNYMIMELIEGCSLMELQTQRGAAIPWEEACDYITQAAHGLEAAQAAGITHRDIKPENLMLTKKKQIKVSDFGLAKEADDSMATSVETVMGTPAFMSPEQCEGKKTDARSDIYSLGGTFYWMVTNRLPFEAETAMAMMYRHKHEPLVPPNDIVKSIPAAISAVIVKMMGKRREQRQQSMAEVAEALAAARATLSTNTAPAAGQPGPLTRMLGAAEAPAGGGVLSESGRKGGRQASSPFNTDLALQVIASAADLPAIQAEAAAHADQPSVADVGIADEGYAFVARGDDLLARGDRIGAMKFFQQALQAETLDEQTHRRIEQELHRELGSRRQTVEDLLGKGLLLEASRECRVLADIDPKDDSLRKLLKEVEQKLSRKRTLVNDVRAAIAAQKFEDAISLWDRAPAELRDSGLGKQVEELRVMVLPAAKLAAQGEALNAEGRLQEAVEAFRDALKVNPGCEAARSGVQDAEQKIQRVEFLLKEGYQHSLDQNFVKAIETWKPILELQPGHPQVKKNMLEAYLAHAASLRAQGDLEMAQAMCQRAVQLDTGHRVATATLAEVTALREKEAALIDQAHLAAARGRTGEALARWRDVKTLNPANKRAAQQLDLARRHHRRRLVGFTAVIAGLAAGGFLLLKFLDENAALDGARQAIAENRFEDAHALLAGRTLLFHGSAAHELLLEAGGKEDIQRAAKLEQDGKLDAAAQLYQSLVETLRGHDPALAQQMSAHVARCRGLILRDTGRAQTAAGQWADAAQSFDALAQIVQAQPAAGTLLKDLEQEAALASACLQKITDAQRDAANNKRTAFEEFTAAAKLAQDLKHFDARYAACETFAREQSLRLGYDPARAQELLDAGIAKLRAAPPDIAGALKDFRAASASGVDASAAALTAFASDLDYCDTRGMALISRASPLVNAGRGWGGDERKAAFCIDRYEWPNQSGAMPLGNVTYVEAAALCESRGKKLCSRLRWIDACKGGQLERLYPYGDGKTPSTEFCNAGSGKPLPNGAKPCGNALGVFDMCGNLAEWTDSDDPNSAAVMGGSFATPLEKANCGLDYEQENKTTKVGRIGFRCCSDLP